MPFRVSPSQALHNPADKSTRLQAQAQAVSICTGIHGHNAVPVGAPAPGVNSNVSASAAGSDKSKRTRSLYPGGMENGVWSRYLNNNHLNIVGPNSGSHFWRLSLYFGPFT